MMIMMMYCKPCYMETLSLMVEELLIALYAVGWRLCSICGLTLFLRQASCVTFWSSISVASFKIYALIYKIVLKFVGAEK
jgi:hypothetical protein